MRLSKNGIKVLTAQYRAVLKKCLLINMGLFVAFSANAQTIEGDFSGTITDINIQGSAESIKRASISEAQLDRNNDNPSNYTFNYADVEITNSDMETKGNISITNSLLSFSCTGNDCKPDEKGPGDGFLGFDVSVKDSTLTMGQKGDNKDYAYIGANHNFQIDHSSVELNNNATFAYEGDDEKGVFEISNGSKIW